MNEQQQQTSRRLGRMMREYLMDEGTAPKTDTEDRSLWRTETILAGFYDEPDDEDDPGMAVRDLLTDVVHYCRVHDIDLDDELVGAWSMARQELGEWQERAS